MESRAPGDRAESGIAIVEVIVAAVILGLAFIGITSMLASGRNAMAEATLRRQALQFAMNDMEDTAFGNPRYGTAATGARTRLLRLESGGSISALDSVIVGPEMQMDFQDPDVPAATVPVAYKSITAKVLWSMSGRRDSVTLIKRISKVP